MAEDETTGGSSVRINPAETPQKVKELQDRGLVDLDAPLRDAIPQIARAMGQVRRRPKRPESETAGGTGAEMTAAEGYCLVGDRGWFSQA